MIATLTDGDAHVIGSQSHELGWEQRLIVPLE
jgi:hypothetical protein